jgi:hypothetical protein
VRSPFPRHCYGLQPPSPLSSRPERSAVEGPAVRRLPLGNVFSTGGTWARGPPKKMMGRNIKWAAQVSLLRPGYSGQDSFARRNPGLKSETWATHLKSGGCSLIFDRAKWRDLRLFRSIREQRPRCRRVLLTNSRCKWSRWCLALSLFQRAVRDPG